jgi:hypothetical protein
LPVLVPRRHLPRPGNSPGSTPHWKASIDFQIAPMALQGSFRQAGLMAAG